MSRVKFLSMLLLLAVGGLAVWETERRDLQAALKNGPQEAIIFYGVTANDLDRITISRPGSSFAVDHHPDNSWTFRRPEGAPADPKKMLGIVRTLTNLRARNVLEQKEIDPDQSVYGLVPPELVLAIEGKFGKRVVSFGKKVPVSGRRYLQPENDNRVFLVDEGVFTTLNIDVDSIRDHFPVKFLLKDVNEMTVVRGETDYLHFLKTGEDWSLEFDGGRFAPDVKLLAEQLARLQRLKVKRFVDEPGAMLAPYGLVVPKLIVNLVMTAEKPGCKDECEVGEPEAQRVSMQIGEGVGFDEKNPEGAKAARAYYLKIGGSPFIYELEQALFSELDEPPVYFRSRQPWTSMNIDLLDRIQIDHDHAVFNIKRTTNAWSLVAADGKEQKLRDEAVKSWLSELRGIEVLSYPGIEQGAKDEAGLRNASYSMKLFFRGEESPWMLGFGAQVPEDRSGNVSAESPGWIAISHPDGAFVPALLSGELWKRLPKSKAAFDTITIQP